MKRNWRSGKTNYLLWGIIGVVLLFIFGIITFSNGQFAIRLPGSTSTIALQNNGGTVSGGGPYQVQISAYNALTGAAMTSLSTEKVFLPGSFSPFDSSSSTANPVQFGGTNYQNGQTYWVQIGKSAYSTTLTSITASGLSLAGGQTYANLGSVYTVGSPTYALSGAFQNGTTFTTSNTYNFTTASTSQQNLKFTITNTVANTGWISSWDPANKQTENLVCVVNDTASGQALSFSGYGNEVVKGVGQYFTYIIPDGFSVGQSVSPDGQPVTMLYAPISQATQISSAGITAYQPVSTGPVYGGSSGFSISVNKGTLAHGSTEKVGIDCYSGADVTVFNGPNAFYGNFGVDAASVIHLTITFAN